MKCAFLRPVRSATLALCALVAVALSGCGGEVGTSATPGAFTGNFAGMTALDAGRTGTVSLTVQSDGQATGMLTISGDAAAETVPLTGLVDLIGGNFSTSGSSTDGSVKATVSGTLPGPVSSTGFLAVQIGATGNPFHGTIHGA